MNAKHSLEKKKNSENNTPISVMCSFQRVIVSIVTTLGDFYGGRVPAVKPEEPSSVRKPSATKRRHWRLIP